MFHLSKKITQIQCIVYGYIGLILAGTVLLMFPISNRCGEWMNFLDALFTSTSASCVTGLIVVDTYTNWTIFGQIVILSLIQIGGLGFMTLGVGFAIFLHRRIGLWTRGTLQESVNIDQLGGIVRLVKTIIKGTLLIEGIGAIILTIRFVADFPLGTAIYYGIFHSVSAFCNAGFDIMGVYGEYVSLIPYQKDIVVNIVIMSLIVIGGIGFFVWTDVLHNRLHVKQYRLHTKIVIITTLLLIVGGTLCFYLIERNNLVMDGLNEGEKVMAAAFNSVTARTAGFNTTDTGALTPESKLLTTILMFVGGSPGSTAGGIKTTTAAVLMIFMFQSMRQKSCNIFKRRIDDSVIKKATVVIWLNLCLLFAGLLIISFQQDFDLIDIAFEVASALGTVGMTTGITRDLTWISKITLILLMYGGRVGSLSFALSLLGKKKNANISYPVEKVNIG